MSNAQVRLGRQGYFDEERALKEASARRAPVWNPPIGKADVEALVWFDFVHTDDPWAQVPEQAPERPLPSRCGFFTETAPEYGAPALN